jgi:hypothetical protein
LDSKEYFTELVRILKDESYYMPKFLDLYYDLPKGHQTSFARFLHSHINRDDWEEWAADPFLYPEIIKGVLMHYSGREEFDEPTKDDLTKLIGEYVRSSEFDLAEQDGKTLNEMLEENLK